MRIPHFIIGGAPRSGTTFLCHFLDSHPDIFMAKPFIPEPKIFLTPCENGESGYIKRYEAFFINVDSEKILGEKTSIYLENEQAFNRICKTFQQMKFVFIVREPIERAYSNYLWSTKNGLETMSFEEAIEMEGKRDNPLPKELDYAKPFDYLIRGDYGRFARRYIGAFGQSNVKFFLYENLVSAPEDLLNDIQCFIGVDPIPLNSSNGKAVNTRNPNAPSLDPKLGAKLRERMYPLVEDFANYAGLDVGVWGY